MSHLHTADLLREAQKIVSSPERWCKGWFHRGDAYCMGAAVNMACAREKAPTKRCHEALRKATGVKDLPDIARWNDAPERTHEDVMACFDRAILAAEGER